MHGFSLPEVGMTATKYVKKAEVIALRGCIHGTSPGVPTYWYVLERTGGPRIGAAKQLTPHYFQYFQS